MEERPFPERYTADIVRDSLGEAEFAFEDAVNAGDIAKAKEFIGQGVNVDTILDSQGRTGLMIACASGCMEMVQYLVEQENADMDGPIARNGFRAIDFAGKEQFRWPNPNPIADYLKSKGSQYTWWGAACAGDIRRLNVFIENGQDINDVNPILYNWNALDCAIHTGNAKAAAFLVARGAFLPVRNCQPALLDTQMWSLGRDDSYMYKEWGVEQGPYAKV